MLSLPAVRKKDNHIQNLILEGEHQMLDFKFEISDSRRIARSLAAFANTDGGRLLVGVKDNGAIAGVRSDEEIHMIQAAAEMYCQPQVEYTTEEWEINGKTVLEVIIPKDKHHKHKAPDNQGNYKIFVRVKDENLVADSVLIKVWKSDKFSKAAKISPKPRHYSSTTSPSTRKSPFRNSSKSHILIRGERRPSSPISSLLAPSSSSKPAKTRFFGSLNLRKTSKTSLY